MDDSLNLESYEDFGSDDDCSELEDEEVAGLEKNQDEEEEEKELNSEEEEDDEDDEEADDDSFVEFKRDDNTRGVPFLTKFERARVLGVRTQQINSGAKIFVERKEGDSSLDIATRELLNKRMPFLICRNIRNTLVYISVNDLIIL